MPVPLQHPPGALPGRVLSSRLGQPPRRPGRGGCAPGLRHRAAVVLQVLYRKSMQALDLLLRTFVSENKSMDEVCFLLQVRAGLRHRGLRAFPGVHSGWVPGGQARPAP